MTIRRGEPWGAVGPAPAGMRIVQGDAAAGAEVATARRAGTPVPPLGLLGGDLMRAVGGTGDAARFERDACALLPVDVLRVEIPADADGDPTAVDDTTWAVAHVVVRRSWWRGEVLALVNAQFVGTWDVAPRSHPNDGRVDVVRVDAAMGVRARLQAHRRLRSGTHVPHPAITIRQVPQIDLRFDRPVDVHVDGKRWRRTRALRCVVERDATTVVV
jgi:hypothetical protein